MSIAKHRELLVLSTIRSHEAHGYALAEALEQGLGRALGLKRSTIYAILGRFIDRGWVRTRADRQGSYPERQVCLITAKGRRALPELRSHVLESDEGSLLPLAVVVAHLDDLPASQRADVLARLMERKRAELDQLAAFPAHEGSAGVALTLMQRVLQAELDAVEALQPSR